MDGEVTISLMACLPPALLDVPDAGQMPLRVSKILDFLTQTVNGQPTEVSSQEIGADQYSAAFERSQIGRFQFGMTTRPTKYFELALK